MSSLKYSVEIEYFSRGLDGATNGALGKAHQSAAEFTKKLGSGIESIAGKFNDVFDSAAGSMISSFTAAAQTVGTVFAAGMAAAVHEAFKFNAQMEEAQIGMATMFGQNGVGGKEGIAPFVTGMRLAQLTVTKMRQDAMDLPGTFEDLQGIMTTIVGPAAHAGLDATGAENLAADAMVVGKIHQIAPTIMARELGMMLAGHARGNMPLMAKVLPGMSATTFNAMDEHKRLQTIRGGFEGALTGKAALMGTWSTLSSNLVDTIKQKIGLVGNPLFEAVKGKIGSILGLGPDGKPIDPGSKAGQDRAAKIDKLTMFGLKVGDYLAKAFEESFATGERLFARWYQPAKNFISILHDGIHSLYLRAKPFIDAITGAVAKFVDSFSMSGFDKIVKGGTEMLAMRAASGVLGEVGGGMGSIGGLLGSLGKVGVSMSELAIAGPIVVAAVAALGIAVYGAVHALTDSSSSFHGTAVSLAEHTGKTLGALTKAGSGFNTIADAMGTGLLLVVDTAAMQILALTAEFQLLGQAVMWIVDHVPGMKGLKKDPVVTPDAQDPEDLRKQRDDARNDLFSERYGSNKRLDTEGHDLNIKPANVTNHITNHIKIDVNGTEDPDRVAKTVVTEIKNQTRYPTTTFTTGDRIRDARSY